MKTPYLPGKLLALVLLVAMTTPAGCRLLPTMPARTAVQTTPVHARRDGPAADTVQERFYFPNPYFGHVSSIFVETTGQRARLTAVFDRPFRGRLGTEFYAYAYLFGRPDTILLVTEGAHRCAAYRMVVKFLRDGSYFIVPELVGTSSARAVKERLVMEFSADLLPQQEFARDLRLGANAGGFVFAGHWRQVLKQSPTGQEAMR